MLIGMALFKLGVFVPRAVSNFISVFWGFQASLGSHWSPTVPVQLIGQNWDPSFSLLQHGAFIITWAVLALRCFMWGASC